MVHHQLELSVPRHLLQLAMAIALFVLTISLPVQARFKPVQLPACPYEPSPPAADLPPGFHSNQWTSFQHYCTASDPGPNCRCLTNHITGHLTVECLPRLGNMMFAHGPVVATNECLMYCACGALYWGGAGLPPPGQVG